MRCNRFMSALAARITGPTNLLQSRSEQALATWIAGFVADGTGYIGLADWIEAVADKAIAKSRRLKSDATLCELWQNAPLGARLNHDGEGPRA